MPLKRGVVSYILNTTVLFPALRKIQKHFNWESTNFAVSGLYENYLFRVEDYPGYKSISILLPKLNIAGAQKLESIFKSNKDSIEFSNIQIGEKLIYFQFEEKWKPFGYSKLKNGIEKISQILRNENIEQSIYCFECGTSENLVLYEAIDIYKSTLLLCNKDALIIESEMNNHHSNYFSFTVKQLLKGLLSVSPFHILIVIAASISPLSVAYISPLLPLIIYGVTIWIHNLMQIENNAGIDSMSYVLLIITLVGVDYFIVKEVGNFWIAIISQILGMALIFPFIRLTIKCFLKPKMNELQNL